MARVQIYIYVEGKWWVGLLLINTILWKCMEELWNSATYL